MTTKPTTNGHAARLLKEVRELFRTSLVFGPEVPPIARAAARSAGFGAEMIDAQILRFVSANYGTGWRADDDRLPWQPGGGDEQLERLFADEASTIADGAKAETEYWAFRDKGAALRQQTVDGAVLARATAETAQALERLEAARGREHIARARTVDRQLFLQERYRRAQAKAKK